MTLSYPRHTNRCLSACPEPERIRIVALSSVDNDNAKQQFDWIDKYTY